MSLRIGLADALRHVRYAKGLSQEDFSEVSSRTYMSSLERGLKSPTLEKISHLAQVMGIHPLTLLTLAYAASERCTVAELQARVRQEIDALKRS